MAFNKEKVMDAARKYVEKGQVDRAVKEYLRVVREDPQDVRVWLKIGDLYARKGQKPEATDTYLKVARFYQDQGFFTKAVAVYKQILKLDGRLVEVHLKLAELYRQLGLMSDAMQHFEQVAAHFHREGKTREALATVRQLVELDPANVATRIKLAELYSKEGMNEEAVAEFTAVCEQLRRQNRLDDFIKVAERLLFHRPELRELNRELAGLYLRKNDPRRALQKLQICFKADPRDVETLGLLAQAFQALDQRAKTVSVLKELARILDETKQRAKAEDVYRKILQFAPGDPDAAAYLGGGAARGAVPVGAAPSASASAPMPPPAGAAPSPAAMAAMAARGQLNLTGDVPALRAPNDPRMTGAMPLIDERALGAEFALPEDDGEVAYATDELDDIALIEEPDEGSGLGRAGRAAADFAADFAVDDRDARAGSAAGEEHADEIAKILTETDVYVKYGLHQKAVDHLRRVFALDPENVEARERLRDVYLAQGREADAIAELLHLAEVTASFDSERAEGYLREVLGLDGSNRAALALVDRFGFDLEVGQRRAPSDFSLDPRELGGGAVAPVEDEFALEQLDYGPTTRAPARADSFDGIDPSLFDRAPSNQPFGRAGTARPRSGGEVEAFAPSASDSTRQVAASEVAGLVARTRGHDAADVALGSPPPFLAPTAGGVPDTWQGDRAPAPMVDAQTMRAAIDAELDDALAEDIDQQVAAELGGVGGFAASTATGAEAYPVPDDELPFDPAAARAFDAVMRRQPPANLDEPATFDPASLDPATLDPGGPSEPGVSGFDGEGATRFGPPPAMVEAHFESTFAAPTATGQAYAGYADPPAYAEPAYAEPAYAEPAGYDGRTIDEDALAFAGPGRFGQLPLEDVLEQADDYAAQGHLREAHAVLQELLVRHPGHPLVSMRVRDVEAALAGAAGGTQTVDVDELEELEPEELEAMADDDLAAAFDEAQEVLAARHDPAAPRRPAVVLEQPVEDSDADTHFDLGLAYKEMGLFDEAIKAFDKVTASPLREVQSRMMIGLCQREQGNLSEAVHQFKAGLHASSITDRERQTLLYEIGTSYEALGDPREAIYYFEMVVKRDPAFLDASERLHHLLGDEGATRGDVLDRFLDDE
ncbi:MAG: tetratricopeptide repeat protein [Kofleriaceae bacterium]